MLKEEVLKEIESRLGLHKRLEIVYLVDSFEINLIYDDCRVLASCTGFTLEDALRKFSMASPR